MMSSIGTLIKRLIKVPDPRKSTMSHEEFMYRVDSILKDRGKTISNEEHSWLLKLFINHKDSEIESFLNSL